MSTEPDTDQLSFAIQTRFVRYGDRRKFAQWVIHILQDAQVVGLVNGPGRLHLTRTAARREACDRINTLRRHRLFVIRITRQHLRDGVGRSCSECAISQALWHNQRRMGMPSAHIRLDSYGAFRDAEGLTIEDRTRDRLMSLPVDRLPEVVTQYTADGQSRWCDEDMVEWSMSFDDWADVYGRSQDPKTLREYQKAHGLQRGDRPAPVSPCSFVLDLDEFTVVRDGLRERQKVII